MKNEIWHIREYDNLRRELTMRVKFLHQTINLAVIFWLIFLLATILFIYLGIENNLLYTFLLLIPIVFDLLALNYQSNQNSLESIARYFNEFLKPVLRKNDQDILGWDYYFAREKVPFRFESITKVFPFVLPSLIPFYFLFAGTSLEKYQLVIVLIDIAFLVLVLENFRYKLRRVKIH